MARLTVKSKVRGLKSGRPKGGGTITAPAQVDWSSCPPHTKAGYQGNRPYYSASKGDVVVMAYLFEGLPLTRQPGPLGPPGQGGVPCGLMKFSTTKAVVGQWVTVSTNFNVSDLRGVRFGQKTLGMHGTPEGEYNSLGEFQGINANTFRIRIKEPGTYVESTQHGTMWLEFYDYVNGAPYLNTLCVSCNIDATHVLQVVLPARQQKHPGGLKTAKKASVGVGYRSNRRGRGRPRGVGGDESCGPGIG